MSSLLAGASPAGHPGQLIRTKLLAGKLKRSATTVLAVAWALRFRPGRGHQHHGNIGPTAANGLLWSATGPASGLLPRIVIRPDRVGIKSCQCVTLAVPRQAFSLSCRRAHLRFRVSAVTSLYLWRQCFSPEAGRFYVHVSRVFQPFHVVIPLASFLSFRIPFTTPLLCSLM